MSCHPDHCGGAGVRKSFLIKENKEIKEYLKRVLRYPNQNLVTVFNGKAATGINDIRLYSVFHLPVKLGLKY